MDEEDGRPGARSRQFGYSNASAGVPPQSLFQHFCARGFRFPRKWTAGLIPAGAKAQDSNKRFFGTTEVMPCYKTTEVKACRNTTDVAPFHKTIFAAVLRSYTP